jgi:hypothetical protein
MMTHVVATLIAFAMLGCSSQKAPQSARSDNIDTAFDPRICKPTRPASEPDLMAWDSAARLNIRARIGTGLVAVRYVPDGCQAKLELLNCIGDGKYAFSAYASRESKTAGSRRELFTQLPLGAATLEGSVGGGRSLRTDYILAGLYDAGALQSFPASKLTGDCARATHVIDKVYVGAFAMASDASSTIRASASLFRAEAGGSALNNTSYLAEEGSLPACQKAHSDGSEQKLCGVPLRIGLTPLLSRVDEAQAQAEAAARACPKADAIDIKNKVAGDWYLSESRSTSTYKVRLTESIAQYGSNHVAIYTVDAYGWHLPSAKFWTFDGTTLSLTDAQFRPIMIMSCASSTEWNGELGSLRRSPNEATVLNAPKEPE